MDFNTIFTQMITLFIPMLAGIVAQRCHLLDNGINTALTKLILNITLPCMVVGSIGSAGAVPERQTILMLVALSTAGYAIAAVIAYAVGAFLHSPREERSAWHFSICFGNVGFYGYPVLSAIFGPRAILYAAIANIPFNLFNFGFGPTMIKAGVRDAQTEKSGNRVREMLHDMVNPTFAASLILLALELARVEDLGIVGDGASIVGNFTTPAVLLIMGSTLASYKPSEMVSNWRAFAVAAARLIAVPLAILLVLGGFVSDPIARGVLVLGSGMPCASNGILFSLLYGADPKPMMQANFISIIGSLLTIPLIALLL